MDGYPGFTRPPGSRLGWAMFCCGTFTIVSLTGTKHGRTEPVNVYARLTPGSFLPGPAGLQTITIYLIRTGTYDRIDGHGRVLSATGEQPLEVRNSRVVVS
ncbi:hypothetical protein [Streptomyces sp. UNOB3_S3]|uniref:hypothetical protein n=1 Tax=Streptomyces sp. UNOB3_S3 TaxID=2871682 RepID=UPI001E2FB1B4|nr:hypothetical protein [Streptomyces sp. UNOB3_S3]